jgi:hypothetical protein
MNESRGWVRDRDLFGGRDFGHSDQVTFLILRVQPLPLERVGASAEWRRSRRRGAGPSSLHKAPKRGAERVVSDLVRRSGRFGLSISCKACPPSGRLIILSANNCASTAAPSRNVVDLRSLTPRPQTRQPKSWQLGLPSRLRRHCEDGMRGGRRSPLAPRGNRIFLQK